MPASILRWKGGSGGDMILHIVSATHTIANAKYLEISADGKTEIDFSWLDHDHLTEVQKLALMPENLKEINLPVLADEIAHYQKQSNCVWIKSHYYDTNIFNNITIDIVADPLGLPFVVNSNIKKTETLELPFNDLVSKISDKGLKIKYSMYSVAVDQITPEDYISDRTINVSDLLSGENNFRSALEKNHIVIDEKCYSIWYKWLLHNASHIPGKKYQNKIFNKDYDYTDSDLSLAERYSLMALSKHKFVNLQE